MFFLNFSSHNHIKGYVTFLLSLVFIGLVEVEFKRF